MDEDVLEFIEWAQLSEYPEGVLDEWEEANLEQVRLLTPLVAVAPEGATEEEQTARRWALGEAQKKLRLVASAREFFSRWGGEGA